MAHSQNEGRSFNKYDGKCASTSSHSPRSSKSAAVIFHEKRWWIWSRKCQIFCVIYRVELKGTSRHVSLSKSTSEGRVPRMNSGNEIESNKNFQIFSGLIQFTKILYSQNYSIGSNFVQFLHEVDLAEHFSYASLLDFEHWLIGEVFKDYNITRKDTKWILKVSFSLIDELIFLAVS